MRLVGTKPAAQQRIPPIPDSKTSRNSSPGGWSSHQKQERGHRLEPLAEDTRTALQAVDVVLRHPVLELTPVARGVLTALDIDQQVRALVGIHHKIEALSATAPRKPFSPVTRVSPNRRRHTGCRWLADNARRPLRHDADAGPLAEDSGWLRFADQEMEPPTRQGCQGSPSRKNNQASIRLVFLAALGHSWQPWRLGDYCFISDTRSPVTARCSPVSRFFSSVVSPRRTAKRARQLVASLSSLPTLRVVL